MTSVLTGIFRGGAGAKVMALPSHPPRSVVTLVGGAVEGGLIATYRVVMDPRAQQDIAATAAAHRELGPGFEA
jgi:hypothetical protein